MLKKLTIHKFRSCEGTTIEFDQSLSALCGKNGVGKTTILRAIEWLTQTVNEQTPSRWAAFDRNEFISIEIDCVFDAIVYSYSIKSSPPGRDSQGLMEESLIREANGRATPLFVRRDAVIRMPASNKRILKTSRSTPAMAVLQAQLSDDDPLLKHVGRFVSFLQGIRYYPLKGNEDEAHNNLVLAKEYNEWRAQYEHDGSATNSVNLRLIYLWNAKRELFDELLALIGQEGLGLVSHLEVATPPVAESLADRTHDVHQEIKFYLPLFRPFDTMGGRERFLGFSELSEGSRRVIRIVTSLIFDDRSLMMLEQPEDAIHPGLLHKVIDLLKTYSDRTQVLMATHSPTVLDALDPENILLVTAPRGVTRVQKLSEVELQHARSFLQDEGTLSEFLEPMVDRLSVEDGG